MIEKMAVQQCPVCSETDFEVCAVNPAHTINCGVSVFTKRIVNAICNGCGLVQNVPSLSDEELGEIYRAMTRNVQDGVKVDFSSLPIEHAQQDGNRDLQGHQYFERPVLSPNRLPDLGADQIVISAREAETEIANYLETLGLSSLAVRLYGQ